MQKLIDGIHHFQQSIFSSQRELFERLAGGQSPETLFIPAPIRASTPT